MDRTNYNNITNDNITTDYNNKTQDTINYVDDSTNIIASNDYSQIQNYINDFYKLLETYYDINKLKIKADKSKIIIICEPSHKQVADTIQLQASSYTILQSDYIKILGVIYTKTFDNTKNLNSIISKVTYRLNTITNILSMAPPKTRKIISNCLLISIIRYGTGRMTTLTDS